jgi:serine phosphatase RsbU (regulator of sigma subunit)
MVRGAAGPNLPPSRRSREPPGRRRRLDRWPWRRRGHLSIQGTFSLITLINGVVLGYLLLQSVKLMLQSGGNDPGQVVNLLLTALLSILALLSFLVIRRRIVQPVHQLLRESQRIQADRSQGFFSSSGSDEISGLAEGFNGVLATMRQAMDDLATSHRDLLAAQGQINESLDYASILQQAILPASVLQESLGQAHGLLWLPRERVGGDFYLAHREGRRILVGLADCAGHGVAGAMMTMLARAGVERAIRELGILSPAALLARTDQEMRGLLGEAGNSRAVATSMDMALVLIDPREGWLRFAGARLGLHWSDGVRGGRVRGGNRSLGDGRSNAWEDHQIALNAGVTYTLSSDGLIDQSGEADGFSLGFERFEGWLGDMASLPPTEQIQTLHQRLQRFQGRQPQRDDISVILFQAPVQREPWEVDGPKFEG